MSSNNDWIETLAVARSVIRDLTHGLSLRETLPNPEKFLDEITEVLEDAGWVNENACDYCGLEDCDFDCDESQAGGFSDFTEEE